MGIVRTGIAVAGRPSRPFTCPAMKLLQRDLLPVHPVDDVSSFLTDLGGFSPTSFHASVGPPNVSIQSVGVFRGWRVSLCEVVPGRPLPNYLERRQLRVTMRADDGPGIVIFTDAAHSGFVWTWRPPFPSGHLHYVEFNRASRPRQLRAALAALDALVSRTSVVIPDDPVVDRLFRTLVPARERDPEAVDRIGVLLGLIEAFDDPDQVRTVWRRLRSFSVLDEDCADGARLLGAAAVLEMLMMATLERMQAFVSDALMQRDRRRPEHLRDLRALTEASEDVASSYDRVRYVRRLIVQQNLFATVTTRVAGRTVLRDLLGYAGVPDPGVAVIDCNIWRRRPVSGHKLFSGTGAPDEEVALHRKAWEMVRRVRLAGGELQELRTAGCQLQRRRQLLLRQLGDLNEDALAFGRAPAWAAFSARGDDSPG